MDAVTGTIHGKGLSMYKVGFRFEVVKNGLIGIIKGVTATGLYSVTFYENGRLYLCANVFEDTITLNLKIGAYREIA